NLSNDEPFCSDVDENLSNDKAFFSIDGEILSNDDAPSSIVGQNLFKPGCPEASAGTPRLIVAPGTAWRARNPVIGRRIRDPSGLPPPTHGGWVFTRPPARA